MGDLSDALIQNQYFLTRLGERQARTVLPYLEELRRYVNTRLTEDGGTIRSRKHLYEILKDTDAKTVALLSKFTDELDPYGVKLAAAQNDFYTGAITDSVVNDFEPHLATTEQIVVAAKRVPMPIGANGTAVTMNNLMRTYAPQEAKRVRGRIIAGWSTGETTSEIARAISGTKSNRYQDGLLNISRSNAFSLAKTYTSQLGNQAKEVFNKENPELIIGYEILATLDSKTTDICRSLDGEEFLYKSKGRKPRVPLHFNCRSTEVPVIAEEYRIEEGGNRPALGAKGVEKTNSKTTYYSWIKRQPAWFQDKTLGKEKGKIFRNAGLSVEEFKRLSINSLGQPITLEQMKKENRKVREYLNK